MIWQCSAMLDNWLIFVQIYLLSGFWFLEKKWFLSQDYKIDSKVDIFWRPWRCCFTKEPPLLRQQCCLPLGVKQLWLKKFFEPMVICLQVGIFNAWGLLTNSSNFSIEGQRCWVQFFFSHFWTVCMRGCDISGVFRLWFLIK